MSDEKPEIEITDENFDEYFHDVRRCSPQKGEVMVCYTSSAQFVEGHEKRHMLKVIQMDGKIEAATQIMRKLLFANELDAYRVPKEMLKDLISGMTEEEVVQKPYDYTVEIFYYTKPECIPKDDPHWHQITIMNMDEFFEKKELEEQQESGDNGEE